MRFMRVEGRSSTPTPNDGAKSEKAPPSSVSLIHNCQKTNSQPHCRGNDASSSRPHNLNRHIVAEKTEHQLSPSMQCQVHQGVGALRSKDHLMQNIGNHDRLDLTRTDTPLGLGAARDMMEEAKYFCFFKNPTGVCAAFLFTVVNRADTALNGHNGNSENRELGENLYPFMQEPVVCSLLRSQGLGNSHNSWPAKFCTTRPFDLKVENRFCKQSLLTTLEKERNSNKDQHHTLDRQLKSNHTHIIALGSLIGTGLFLSSPIHGPLTLFMAFTLTGLTAWSLMYCLGELVAQFPIDIEISWINYVILYQKLLQFMILLGAVYSIPQIMSVVAGVGFPSDEELGYVLTPSCIAFLAGLYYTPNILKAILSTISEIRMLNQTFNESCTSRLPGHRFSRSKSHGRQVLIMNLLLFTSPVAATATSLDTSTYPSHPSFLLALSIESGKLASLFTTPQPSFPRTFPFPTILLGTLLTTSLTITLYILLQHNTSTKYLLCTSVCLALLLGSVSAVDIPDLVFRYLFFGVNFALMISALEKGFQWINFRMEKKVVNTGRLVVDVEGGNMKDLDAVEENVSLMLIDAELLSLK